MKDRDPGFAFGVFTWAWAFVVLLGMSSEQMSSTPLRVVVTLACTAAMMFPRRPLALVLVCITYVIHWLVDDYRSDFVHTWFDFFGCLMILAACLQALDRDRRAWVTGTLANLSGPAPVLAGVCFFAAGLAKLNIDFLDERLSCASAFYSYQIVVPPYAWLMPDSPFGRDLAIGGTLVLELLGPLLLIPRRTRRLGFLLCFAMMFLLATNYRARYYVFVGPFLALLTLIFDWRPAAELETWLEGTTGWVARAILLVAVVLAMTVAEPAAARADRHLIARVVVVAVLLAYGALALWLPLRGRPERAPRSVAWLWIVFMVGFEALPYFGLNTSRNFTMASNIRVGPAYSNHLLVGRALPVPGDYEAWRRWIGAHRQPDRPVVVNCSKRRRGEDERAKQARAGGIERVD